MDMAMSLSRPHPLLPHSEAGVKLGDEQFARDWNWSERGIYALVGMGIEPGMRYLALIVRGFGTSCAALSLYEMGIAARPRCTRYGRMVVANL